MRTEYYLWWWAFISRFNDDAPGDTINGLRFTEAGLWIRIRMDPRSFSLLDPDPHIECRSRSRRGKFVGKNRKNARKMEENCNFITKYLLNVDKLHCL